MDLPDSESVVLSRVWFSKSTKNISRPNKANSREAYPETFWNCADIQIVDSQYTGQIGCTVAGDSPPTPPPPPPPASAPSPSSGTSSPSPTPSKSYKGWCSTRWNDYSGGKRAKCIPCNDHRDCRNGRQCWGSTVGQVMTLRTRKYE